jgi:hypothetical protein
MYKLNPSLTIPDPTSAYGIPDEACGSIDPRYVGGVCPTDNVDHPIIKQQKINKFFMDIII